MAPVWSCDSADQVWLYDCGRLGNDTGRSRDIDATLWSLGVTRLNGIFLSHADADHFNALPGMLQRFDVDQIVTPPHMLDDKPAVVRFEKRLKRRTVRAIAKGIAESLDSIRLRFYIHQSSVSRGPTMRTVWCCESIAAAPV